MAWMTNAEFRSAFPAAAQASDGALNLASGAAEDELVEFVGQDLVTDAKLSVPVEDAAPKVIRAHSFLTFATFLLNTPRVKKEQSRDSAGMGPVNTQNEYYSANELLVMANEWRAKAIRAVNDYLTEETVEELPENAGTSFAELEIVF